MLSVYLALCSDISPGGKTNSSRKATPMTTSSRFRRTFSCSKVVTHSFIWPGFVYGVWGVSSPELSWLHCLAPDGVGCVKPPLINLLTQVNQISVCLSSKLWCAGPSKFCLEFDLSRCCCCIFLRPVGPYSHHKVGGVIFIVSLTPTFW